MEEIGVVQSVDGVIARVLVEKKSACEKCAAKCNLTEGGAMIEAVNTARAEVGQRVRVEFKPLSYVKGSVLIYGVPALGLIAGAVLGKEVVSRFIPGVDPDLLSAFFGFGGFLVAYIASRLFARTMEKKTEYKPVVEEILK
jgi:sigma-E factor negative regulatory protein RseC